MSNLWLIKICTLASFVGFLGVNYGVQLGLIGKYNNQQISKMFPTHITPSDWTFSIWLLIFLLQTILTIASVLPFWNTEKDDYVYQTNPFLCVVWILESVWALAFSYEIIWLSQVFQTFNLLALFLAFFRIGNMYNPDVNWIQKGFFYLWDSSISINFSWIIVAAAANVAILFSYFGWPLSQLIVAILIGAITAFTIFLATASHNYFVSAVQIWSLLGIADKHRDSHLIAYVCIICIALHSASFFLVTYLITRKRGHHGYRLVQN